MRKINIPIVLKNASGDLILVHESWCEYATNSIDESFGFEQAHSVDGNDAGDDSTWVLMAQHDVQDFEHTDLTVNDYMIWSAKQAADARDAAIVERDKLDKLRNDAFEEQEDASARASKVLKKLNLDPSDLRALLFGALNG